MGHLLGATSSVHTTWALNGERMNAVSPCSNPKSTSTRVSPCRTLAGSDRKLRALVNEYRAFVARSLRRMGVPLSDVDDAAQRVFLVVSRKLASIEPGRERSFLFGVAVRVASEMRRFEARRRRLEVAVEVDAESTPCTDDLLELKRSRLVLDRLLSTMPRHLTTVFQLAETEGLTALEISERLGIPPGTVASRLRRARLLFWQQADRLTGRRAN